MGIGQMRTHLHIIRTVHGVDEAGFDIEHDEIVLATRAAVEYQHASSAWVNRAAYTKATAIFRLRARGGITITEDMVLDADGQRWVIDSAQLLGRWWQIEAHRQVPEGT